MNRCVNCGNKITKSKTVDGIELDGYFVYEHLFPNGKRYIGITKNIKKRWANGLGYNHNIIMKREIIKYGWDNIQHNVLFTNKTKQEAELLEVKLISLYKSNNIEFGYNIDNGGNSIGKHSETTKQKIREYALHRPIEHNKKISVSKTGKKLNLTKEQREKLSLRLKNNQYGVGKQTFLGKHHSQESKNKISLSNKGKIAWNKGKHLTKQHTLKSALSHQKPVIQYNIDFEFVKEFPSVKIAMNETHINNIGKACKKIQKTAGGFIWEYKIQAGIVEKVEQ